MFKNNHSDLKIEYYPIGYFHSDYQKPYEAPRQGVLSCEEGYISFCDRIVKDCYLDLVGFDRIWIIYDFHKNKNWKPKVMPPRGSEKKKSVFATRAPYRPNSIGMSCVKLDKIEGKRIYVSDHDLLDGTPVLDIKPYLSYADSFPEVSMGWLEDVKKFELVWSPKIEEKLIWMDGQSTIDFRKIIFEQLSFNPTSRKSKRVKNDGDGFLFSLQTWRVFFLVVNDKVYIEDLWSGYSENDLKSEKDIYKDKDLHRQFRDIFK